MMHRPKGEDGTRQREGVQRNKRKTQDLKIKSVHSQERNWKTPETVNLSPLGRAKS